MPEVRIKNELYQKTSDGSIKSIWIVLEEKGGIFLTREELEMVRFIETEYKRIQDLLKNKLREKVRKVVLE